MSLYPNMRQVRAFVSVAETSSFTKAAQLMNLTQSAISHSIKSLEEQLGVCLIERAGKRLSITQDGNIYLARCRKVIHELDVAQQELILGRRNLNCIDDWNHWHSISRYNRNNLTRCGWAT